MPRAPGARALRPPRVLPPPGRRSTRLSSRTSACSSGGSAPAGLLHLRPTHALPGLAARPTAGTLRPQHRCRSSEGSAAAPCSSGQVGGGAGASLRGVAAIPPPAPLPAPGETGLPEGGSSLIQRCLSEGLRRIIPVCGGTSHTPGPAVGLGTATATVPCHRANQRPSRRPVARTAPGTAACTERGPGALHATKPPPGEGHQDRRHLGEDGAGALTPRTCPDIPNLPRAPPTCPGHPCIGSEHPQPALSIPNPTQAPPLLPGHPALPWPIHLQPPRGRSSAPGPWGSHPRRQCLSRTGCSHRAGSPDSSVPRVSFVLHRTHAAAADQVSARLCCIYEPWVSYSQDPLKTKRKMGRGTCPGGIRKLNGNLM